MPITAVSVKGLNELRVALKAAAAPGVPTGLARANKSAAELVAGRARAVAPVGRTGKLQASVRALGSQRAGRVRAGSAAVPYAAAIHWGRKVGNVGRPPGNRKGRNPIRGRPFLWDTAKASRPAVAVEFEKALKQVLNEALKGR